MNCKLKLKLLIVFLLSVNSIAFAQLVVITNSSYDSLLRLNPNEKLKLLNVKGFKSDIRYATSNNFTHQMVYDTAVIFLATDAHKALLGVIDDLKKQNLGLVIYDAYRPYQYTIKFWELIHDDRYVANPSKGSRHNRGCAIDVGLYNLLTDEYLLMPTPYDDFSEKAGLSSSNDWTKEQKKNIALLQAAMIKNGFQTFSTEWWHFDFKGWAAHPIFDVSFQYLLK